MKCDSICTEVNDGTSTCAELVDGAEGWAEGVGDELDGELGWDAEDEHDVILDSHGETVETDVAVGGSDQVVDFLLCDGFHGVKVGDVTRPCLDLDDM